MRAYFACLALLLCSMNAACGGPSGEACTLDTDCASGFCKANGTCGDAETDGGMGDDSGDGTDGSMVVCTPDHNGIITKAELPFAAGRMANFRIATDATWNTGGVAATNGERTWDLSGMLANDQDTALALAAPGTAWWAATFPGATYSTPLVSTSDLRGVFQVSANNLTLLGVVSPDGGSSKTELEYDGPINVIQTPLQAGSTWSTTSLVSGVTPTFPFGTAYTEAYVSSVDHVGTMKTPYGDFPVLRVVTDMTRSSGGVPFAYSRTFSWIAECFGPVATVTSTGAESGEFEDISEARRLAP
jgi:hypothetical protein